MRIHNDDLFYDELDFASAKPFPNDRGPLDSPVHLPFNGGDWPVMEADEEYIRLESPNPETSVPEAKTSAHEVLPTGSSFRDLRMELRNKLDMKTKLSKVDCPTIPAPPLQDAQSREEPTGIRQYTCSKCGQKRHNKRTCKKSQTSGK